MSALQELAKAFGGEDVSWIHDGVKGENELMERGDRLINFLFAPFPDLKLPSGFRALEIGSGLGYIMEALNRYAERQGIRAESITGLDIAAPMLEKAKARVSGPPFEFLHYDGLHIPLANGTLDPAYSVASLQHIPKQFVYHLFFEIKRLLSPTGFAVLHFIGFRHIPNSITKWEEIVRAETLGKPYWIYFYSAEELRFVLSEGTGFKDVRIEGNGEAFVVALSNRQVSPKFELDQPFKSTTQPSGTGGDLKRLYDEHAALSASFANFEEKYAEHTNFQNENRRRIIELEASLQSLFASRSWRVTAPLRTLSSLIRR